MGAEGCTFRRCASPAVAHVDGGLLLAGETLHEVVVSGTLNRNGPARGVLERVEVILDLVADVVLLQVARRVGVLFVDEGARFGALGVFEPAVVVRDFGAEVVVDDRIGFDRGRWGKGDAVAAVDGLGITVGSEQNNEEKTSDAPHRKPPANRILGKFGGLRDSLLLPALNREVTPQAPRI